MAWTNLAPPQQPRGLGSHTLIDRPPAIVLILKGRPLPVRLWLAYPTPDRLLDLAADERGFAVLRKVREEHAADQPRRLQAAGPRPVPTLKLDEARAVVMLPELLAGHAEVAAQALPLLEECGNRARPARSRSRRPARTDRCSIRRHRVGPGQSPAPSERVRRQGCRWLTFPRLDGTSDKLLRERGAYPDDNENPRTNFGRVQRKRGRPNLCLFASRASRTSRTPG